MFEFDGPFGSPASGCEADTTVEHIALGLVNPKLVRIALDARPESQTLGHYVYGQLVWLPVGNFQDYTCFAFNTTSQHPSLSPAWEELLFSTRIFRINILVYVRLRPNAPVGQVVFLVLLKLVERWCPIVLVSYFTEPDYGVVASLEIRVVEQMGKRL